MALFSSTLREPHKKKQEHSQLAVKPLRVRTFIFLARVPSSQRATTKTGGIDHVGRCWWSRARWPCVCSIWPSTTMTCKQSNAACIAARTEAWVPGKPEPTCCGLLGWCKYFMYSRNVCCFCCIVVRSCIVCRYYPLCGM